MIRWQPVSRSAHDTIGGPALVRLERLAPAAIEHFDRFAREGRSVQRRYRARRDILSAGQTLAQPAVVVDGWVCHHRLLQDGRRQIISLTLPGEVLIPELRAGADAMGAINDVVLIDGPPDVPTDAVGDYYALNAQSQQAYLIDQVIRLGRQVAYERVAHLLLELHARLSLSGLVDGNHFRMPLTQESLADLLGLTSVHVNRTLQMLKRDRLIDSRRGGISLLDRPALIRLSDFHSDYVESGTASSGASLVQSSGRPTSVDIRQVQLL